MASKHSNGFGFPAEALMMLGVMITNLLAGSALLFSILFLPWIFRMGLGTFSSLIAGDAGLADKRWLFVGDGCEVSEDMKFVPM
jgi:hypothetical protein